MALCGLKRKRETVHHPNKEFPCAFPLFIRTPDLSSLNGRLKHTARTWLYDFDLLYKAPVVSNAAARMERQSPPAITKPRLLNTLDITHTPFLIDEPVSQLLLAVPNEHRSAQYNHSIHPFITKISIIHW